MRLRRSRVRFGRKKDKKAAEDAAAALQLAMLTEKEIASRSQADALRVLAERNALESELLKSKAAAAEDEKRLQMLQEELSREKLLRVENGLTTTQLQQAGTAVTHARSNLRKNWAQLVAEQESPFWEKGQSIMGRRCLLERVTDDDEKTVEEWKMRNGGHSLKMGTMLLLDAPSHLIFTDLITSGIQRPDGTIITFAAPLMPVETIFQNKGNSLRIQLSNLPIVTTQPVLKQFLCKVRAAEVEYDQSTLSARVSFRRPHEAEHACRIMHRLVLSGAAVWAKII